MALKLGGMHLLATALIVLSSGTFACQHPTRPKTKLVWRPVGSWSGHGDTQTDSFDIGYNDVRIRWETKNEKPPGAGTFRLAVCSAVSGRELTVPVNSKGVGHNLVYISVDPHWSYLLINSRNLDWSVTVEEQATVETK